MIFRSFSTRFAVDRCFRGIGQVVALGLVVIAHGAIGGENVGYGGSTDRMPNIVFILADDLRPDGLRALGNPIVKTPSLDRLVEQGVVFRSAYTQGSSVGAVCLPSRTMIQTGQSYLHARRDAPTLAQTVRRAGFASIRSGKFGNNPNRLDADFDQHVDGINAQGNADNVIRFIRAQAGKAHRRRCRGAEERDGGLRRRETGAVHPTEASLPFAPQIARACSRR